MTIGQGIIIFFFWLFENKDKRGTGWNTQAPYTQALSTRKFL